MERLKRNDLVYPELSYKIMGCAYDVFNKLGYGLAEKHYQKALALSLAKKSLTYKEQVYFPIKYEGEMIRKGFCDFLVEDKVIVELKKNMYYSISHIEQVNQYLISGNLRLAILLNFSPRGVFQKRILNTSGLSL